MHKEICPCQQDQVLGAKFGCLHHQVLQTMSRLDRLFVPALTPETHVLLGQTKNHLSHKILETAPPELVPGWNYISLLQTLPQVLQTHPKLLPKVKH
jgi:hypothetical protein